VKTIALEEHFSIPELAEQWPFAWAPARSCSAKLCRGRGTQAPEFTEYQHADMDATGIDVQVLSHTVPGVQADLDAATARDHARSANDYLARVAAEHPDGLPMRRASATPCSRCRTAGPGQGGRRAQSPAHRGGHRFPVQRGGTALAPSRRRAAAKSPRQAGSVPP
jgi:hypothetical protein